MNTGTTKDQASVYGIRPQKPGMYLGLFHGRDTPHEAMSGWGFDGPALGPLKHVHTTYACSMNVEFTSLSDAYMFTGSNDTFLELQLDGDLLCFDGKLYGDWTVYMVKPEECFRLPDSFRQKTALTICADKSNRSLRTMTANICGQGEHKMALSTDWTRSETLAAFHIYLQLPFGQLHRNQPRIVQ